MWRGGKGNGYGVGLDHKAMGPTHGRLAVDKLTA